MGAITIVISDSSGRPLYEQIAGQIRSQVLAGTLPGGTQLPSIRLLARELQVSIITTKRAYEELERDGILRTVAGRGTFVCEHTPERRREMHGDEVKEALRAAARKAKNGGMEAEDFMILSAQIFKEESQ